MTMGICRLTKAKSDIVHDSQRFGEKARVLTNGPFSEDSKFECQYVILPLCSRSYSINNKYCFKILIFMNYWQMEDQVEFLYPR